MNNIPEFYLDWDYDTFSLNDDETLNFYEDEIYKNKPELIYIRGWIAPGYKYLDKRLAKLVDRDTMRYKLEK